MKQIASLLLAAALLAGCRTSQPPRFIAGSGDLVIENVTVVPMDREGELPRHAVVVRGDRIVAVEPMGSVQVSRDAIRIDGAGKWLMPGVVLRGRWLPGHELRTRLTAIAESYAHPRQRNVPAPVIEGLESAPGHEAHYEIEESGSVPGEERLVAGRVGGQRVIAANEYFDDPVATRHSYRLDAASSTMVIERSYGKLEVALRVDGERLIGSGSSFRGKPIAFSMPFPKGAFLTADGVGGLIALTEQIKALPVGGRTTVVGFEPSYSRTPNVLEATFAIERKPDAGGKRTYAISKRVGSRESSGELVLDADGWPLLQSFGPPIDTVIRRLAEPPARIP